VEINVGLEGIGFYVLGWTGVPASRQRGLLPTKNRWDAEMSSGEEGLLRRAAKTAERPIRNDKLLTTKTKWDYAVTAKLKYLHV
jgi:hypothetical protein